MKQYLGDAVYASDELNPGHITLTTGDHNPDIASNVIHLEPSIISALNDFVSSIRKAEAEDRAQAIIQRLPESIRWKAAHFMTNQIDIDNLEHDEALLAMRSLCAGRWERKESGVEGKLDYIATINGFVVRLWAAGPPDTCRIVEEEYEIPASKGTRKRLICHGDAAPNDTIALQ